MKQLITALVFSLLCFATASAQDFTPLVTQFAKKDYKAHHQNWSISNDRNGVVYFGNGSCLLAYDGKIWSKYSMPFNKIVRSVLVVDDVIYVGSYEEFGCFTKKDNGQLEYRSISDLLSDYEMQNDEIWSIIYDRDKIIFKAFTSYFIFDGEKVIAHKTPYLLQFFCKYNDTLYTHAENLGLHTIDLETAELTKVESPFNSKLISIIERGDGTSYFITYSDGIYLFDGKEFIRFRTNIDEGLENWQVNRVTQAENGDLYIGTLLNGAICLDKYGKTKWIINTSNVLQSNTILGIHIDENENLWLALDSGIALIPTDNSMMYINALQPGVGTVYTTYYDEPHLYMGTGQGLYKSTLSEDFGKVSDIQIIPEIKGNVWDISKYDSQVFISTNSETYELLENGDFEVASPIKGGMCFARGRIAGKDVLVQGTYTHLCIYVKKGGKWVYSHYIDGFLDPVGTVAVDYSGTIWAGHMHRGLYSIKLGYDLKTVESCDYYDSLEKDEFLPIRVYTINERVVFADTKKLYTYDDINKSIIPYEDLNSRIGHFASAYRICESGYGHYWFITESEAARYDVGNKSISEFVSFDAFGNRTADMYQNVIPVTKNIDLFTFENSVALYRLGNQRKQANTNFFIKELKINDISESLDSLIALNEGKVKIPYKYRNLDFTLSCPPQYDFANGVAFSHYLKGVDNVWSEPEASPYIKFRHLPPGNYILQAKAIADSDKIFGELSFEFKIQRPFYRSVPAYLLYIIVVLVAIYGIKLILVNRVKKDKLEEEVKDKSKELVSSAFTLIRKNEALIQVKNELEKIKKQHEAEYPDLNIKSIVNMIDRHLSGESEWEVFQKNFDRIHENFFRNLKLKYPELTANDLKFCAYLRLNLSSKDIASLMNISLKGVEAARSRIRKKINLPSEDSLTSFLIGFKG